MKRVLLIVVVVAMFGWALYDFVLSSDKEAEKTEEKTEENESALEEEDGEEGVKEDGIEVGLEKGNRAPDFELETLDGERIKLSDLQGKPVFLNFFTSWCPPCRAEAPDMQQFHEESDVQVFAVNMYEREQNTDDVPEFIDEFDITFPVVIDESLEVTYRYGVQVMPTTYILDSNGLIVNIGQGAMNYDMMVDVFSDIE